MAENYIEANKELWNKKTPVHLKSEFYDNEAFKAGKNSLNPAELEAFGDVTGKSLLHLQCHFGQDTISWAKMGAKVTGIDLSDVAIAEAKALAKELDVEARFIEGNVYDTSKLVGDEQFDLVFSTYGTICWLPDLDPWAEIVARHLKPGGKFCLIEFHPTYMMFDFDTLKMDFSYFNKEVIIEDEEGSYAEPGAKINSKSYSWNHPFGEILTALLKQGLKLTGFTEYPYSYYNCFPGLEKQENGYYMIKGKENILPLMYRIEMEK